MRKRMGIILAALAVAGLSACGTDTTQTTTEVTEQIVTESEDTTQDNADETEAEATEEQTTEAAEQTAEFPTISITRQSYDDFSETELIDTREYPVISITGDGYPELQQALTDWFDTYAANFRTAVDNSVEDAQMQKEQMGDDFFPYSYTYSAELVRADAKVTSIFIKEVCYLGGAHGSSYCYGVTFDSKTGRELTFSDLGDIKDSVRSYIDQKIESLRQDGSSYEFYEDSIDRFMESPVWYLDENGLNIQFNEYEIGSYAEGALTVTIPYDQVSGMVDDYKE